MFSSKSKIKNSESTPLSLFYLNHLTLDLRKNYAHNFIIDLIYTMALRF